MSTNNNNNNNNNNKRHVAFEDNNNSTHSNNKAVDDHDADDDDTTRNAPYSSGIMHNIHHNTSNNNYHHHSHDHLAASSSVASSASLPPPASSILTFEELLWRCLDDDVCAKYQEAQRGNRYGLPIEGLLVDEFVGFMSQEFYKHANAATQRFFDETSNFLRLKKQLYSLFRRVDQNADNRVSWDDVTTHLLDERHMATQGWNREEVPRYVLSRSVRCTHRRQVTADGIEVSTIADLERKVVAKRREQARIKRLGDVARTEDRNVLLCEPWARSWFFPRWNRLIAFSSLCEGTVLSTDLTPLGTFPSVSSTGRCCDVFEDMHPLTAVVGYSDSIVRLFTLKDKRDRVDIESGIQLALPSAPRCLRRLPTGLLGTSHSFVVGDATGTATLLHLSHTAMEYHLGFGREYDLHSDALMDVLFLPKGQMVTCGLDASIRFTDLEKPHDKYLVLKGHRRGVSHMDFSASHQLLVSAGFEFTPYVWNTNAPTDRPIKLSDHNQPHQACLVGVQFLTDTPMLATCDTAGLLKIWDVRTMKCVQTLADHAIHGAAASEGPSTSHVFSSLTYVRRTNELLAAGRNIGVFTEAEKGDPNTCSSDIPLSVMYHGPTHTVLTAHNQHVVVWDAESGRQLATHPVATSDPFECATAFTVSNRGRVYYVGTTQGTVASYHLTEGRVLQKFENLHKHEVTSLVFLPASMGHLEFVLSTGGDGSLHILTDDQRLPRKFHMPGLPFTNIVHNDGINVSVLSTSDGRLIALELHTVLTRGPICRRDLANTEIVASACVGITPTIAVSDTNGTVQILNMKNLRTLCRWHVPLDTESEDPKKLMAKPAIVCMTHLYTGGVRLLFFAGDDVGRIFTFDLSTLDLGGRAMLSGDTVVGLSEFRRWRAHTEGVVSMSASTSSRILLSSGADRTIHVWNPDGVKLATLCIGRGMRSVRWLSPLNRDGVAPPHSFPPRPNETRVSEGAMMRILSFFAKLRKHAAERRHRLHQSRSLEDDDDGSHDDDDSDVRSGMAQSSCHDSLWHSQNITLPTHTPPTNIRVLTPASDAAIGGDGEPHYLGGTEEMESTVRASQLKQLLMRRVNLKVRYPTDGDLVPTPRPPPPKHHGTRRSHAQQQHQQQPATDKHIDGNQPVASERMGTAVVDPDTATTSYSQMHANKKDPLERFLSTEERAAKHVGHLLTLGSVNRGTTVECSARRVIPTLEQVYKAAETDERREMWESKQIRKLQHSLSTHDRERLSKIKLVRNERQHRRELELERQRDIKGKEVPVTVSTRMTVLPKRPMSARTHNPMAGTPRPPLAGLRPQSARLQGPTATVTSWRLKNS
eukprot:PhM_4_TR12187/c0_g2_i1/m.12820